MYNFFIKGTFTVHEVAVIAVSTHISKDSELTGGRFRIKVATFFPSSIFVSTRPFGLDDVVVDIDRRSISPPIPLNLPLWEIALDACMNIFNIELFDIM